MSTVNLATHNGILTVKSNATGDHRTFRIRTQPADARFAPGERIVSMLGGQDNGRDYRPFGFVKALAAGRVAIAVFKRLRGGQFDALARMLEAIGEHEAAGRVALNFEGRCRKCNRRLTTPESVASGLGPICSGGR